MKPLSQFIVFLLLFNSAQSQIVTTYAGNGSAGYTGDGGAATSANVEAWDVAVDNIGDVYIADGNNNSIRKVDISGTIVTYAGNGTIGFSGDGGPATDAELYFPVSIAVDNAGNVFFCDAQNARIRKISTAGIITTIAGNGISGNSGDGGPATLANITLGRGLAVDKDDNIYFVNAHILPLSPPEYTIRKIDASGIITRFAGDGSVLSFGGDGGPATNAKINAPNDVAVDTSGNVYIADMGNRRVRMVNTSGIISTFAGNGTYASSGDGGMATLASFLAPSGVVTDTAGCVYISDQNVGVLRKVDVAGVITTIAGNGVAGYSGDGGPATAARLNISHGIAIMGIDNIFIASADNYRVRVLNRAPYFIEGAELAMNICMDTPMIVLDTLLAVADEDKGMPLTWSIASGPYHGSASIVYSYPSVGDTIMPLSMSYAPSTGYIGADTLMVRVSDAIAADTFAFYFTVADCALGVNSMAQNVFDGVEIYPNPAQNGHFMVTLGEGFKGDAGVYIHDALGRVVKHFVVTGSKEVNIQLQVSAGTYFVRTVTDDGVFGLILFVTQ